MTIDPIKHQHYREDRLIDIIEFFASVIHNGLKQSQVAIFLLRLHKIGKPHQQETYEQVGMIKVKRWEYASLSYKNSLKCLTADALLQAAN